mmetsp:Transcript_4364/g.11314  ORF Transcript_4364/g.11314 Transcript_4364/m.11314 type:complete len:229 (+) Transcript_4364:141-827(+)
MERGAPANPIAPWTGRQLPRGNGWRSCGGQRATSRTSTSPVVSRRWLPAPKRVSSRSVLTRVAAKPAAPDAPTPASAAPTSAATSSARSRTHSSSRGRSTCAASLRGGVYVPDTLLHANSRPLADTTSSPAKMTGRSLARCGWPDAVPKSAVCGDTRSRLSPGTTTNACEPSASDTPRRTEQYGASCGRRMFSGERAASRRRLTRGMYCVPTSATLLGSCSALSAGVP